MFRELHCNLHMLSLLGSSHLVSRLWDDPRSLHHVHLALAAPQQTADGQPDSGVRWKAGGAKGDEDRQIQPANMGMISMGIYLAKFVFYTSPGTVGSVEKNSS